MQALVAKKHAAGQKLEVIGGNLLEQVSMCTRELPAAKSTLQKLVTLGKGCARKHLQ